MKHITQMAYCCGLSYRRWRFEGKPFHCGHVRCQHGTCASCHKPIKYVSDFKSVRPATSVRRPNPYKFNRVFHLAEIVPDDRPREDGRVLSLIPE